MPYKKEYNRKTVKVESGDSSSKKVMGGQGKSVEGKVLKNHHQMRETGNKPFPGGKTTNPAKSKQK